MTSGYLRYRIVDQKSVYDVKRNKVIARFEDPEDADRYIHWMQITTQISEAIARSNERWRDRDLAEIDNLVEWANKL
jgi:hypothetical protein